MARLPDGCEMDLHVYLTSDSLGADVRVTIRASAEIPAPDRIDARALAKSIKAPDAGDWRVMTREELADYKGEEGA